MLIYKKYGGRIIVTLVTIILLIIIGITASNRIGISFVESKFGNLITPIQNVFYNIGESITNTFSSITNFSQIKYENKLLKESITKLEKDNREMLDIISRAEYLRNQFILKQEIDYEIVEAKIIAKDAGNWFNRFVINKGSKDGIEKGDIIIYGVSGEDNVIEAGLVGKIGDVGDNWSKAISIIDEGTHVSFKVIRTQDNGIIKGSMNSELSGYMFDVNAEVAEGFKIVTSGLGEVFVPDIYIGEIVEIKMESDQLTKKVIVKPAVDFKKLNQVFVIKGKSK